MITFAKHYIDVRDYGAVGDGVTDDTNAIRSAINACYSRGGGIVYFPANNYDTSYVTDTLTIPFLDPKGKGIQLIGEGPYATILKPKNTNQILINFDPSGAWLVAIKDLAIKAHASGSTGPAIDVDLVNSGIFENIAYLSNGSANYAYVFRSKRSFSCKYNRIILNGQSFTGTVFFNTNNGDQTTQSNIQSFKDWFIYGNTACTKILDVLASAQTEIKDCHFEQNNSATAICPGTQCEISGCWFELQGTSILLQNQISGTSNALHIHDNYFSGFTGNTITIYQSIAQTSFYDNAGNYSLIKNGVNFPQSITGFPHVTEFNVIDYGATGDDIHDDTSSIQDAINAATTETNGGTVLFPPGTYKISSTITLPNSPLTIIGSPGKSILNGTITPDGNQAHSILFATPVIGSTTTLSSDATVGNTNFSITSNLSGTIVAGGKISVTSTSLRTYYYDVKAITGSGPYTVTVDRPIRESFTSAGSQVTVITTQPTDIILDGLTFTGTGTRFIEIVAGYRCEGRNLQLLAGVGMTGDLLASFDIGGRECYWRNCYVDGYGSVLTSGGLALESNENSHIENCYVVNIPSTSCYGFAVYDTFDCSMTNCHAANCYVGFGVTADGNTKGAHNTKLINCRSLSGGFADIYIQNGTNHTDIIGFTGKNNTNYGLIVDGTSLNTSLIGSAITNANDNIILSAGSTATKIIGCDLSAATNACINISTNVTAEIVDGYCGGATAFVFSVGAGSEIDVSGFRSTATVSQSLISTAGVMRIRGFEHNGPGGGGINLIVPSARFDMTQSKIIATTACNSFIETSSGGEVYLSNTYMSGTGFGLVPASNTTIYVGLGVDMSGVSTLYFANGGTVAMTQGQGKFTSAATSGTVTLDQKQAQASGIITSVTLTNDLTFNVPAGIPGLQYTVENNTSGAHNVNVGVTGGTAITVAQGKRAIVISDGTNMQRVTADT